MNALFDSYWNKWTIACALGELLGIGAAAATAVAVNHWVGEPATAGGKLLVLSCMLAAGALEGFLLGSFQWRVLREKFPAIPAGQWVGATVAVAVLCWLLGMLPALHFMGRGTTAEAGFQEPSLLLVLMGALALGLLMGSIFGLVQWMVFQRYARESVQWVTGNALGWGLAMVWIFLAATLPDETTPTWLILTGGLLGGAMSGLSLGVVTGFYLRKIIAQNQQKDKLA